MMHDHDLEDGIEFTTVNAKPTAVTHYTPSVKKQIKLDIELPLRPDQGGTDGRPIALRGKFKIRGLRTETDYIFSQCVPDEVPEKCRYFSLRFRRVDPAQEGRKTGFLFYFCPIKQTYFQKYWSIWICLWWRKKYLYHEGTEFWQAAICRKGNFEKTIQFHRTNNFI